MLFISMIVRNEASRHLEKTLKCAKDLLSREKGLLVVTDDQSNDNTVEMCLDYGALVRVNDEPLFRECESNARQINYDFLSGFATWGDWVLALDGDETISDPDKLLEKTREADEAEIYAIGLPLLEFWEPDMYRVDGWWVGTSATRLYRWKPDGRFADKEIGGGSEPTYVARQVYQGRWMDQKDVELHHWGYLRPEERAGKRSYYESRLGGHGHNEEHIASITSKPTLRKYEGTLRY